MTRLFVPPDIDQAHEEWGANCGPGALAALVGKPLSEIRKALGHWPGYSNPTHLQGALHLLDWTWEKKQAPKVQGLAWIQFCGGWEQNARAAYRYTHWIAYRRVAPGLLAAFDVNAENGWLDFQRWKLDIAPALLPKHSTGYRVRMWLEAEPVHAFQEDPAA